MYPLKTLLIGCTDDVLPELRRKMTNLSVAVEGEYLDIRSCLTYVLANPADKRLMIYYPKSVAEIEQLERLNESVPGQPILALVDPSKDPALMIRAMRAGAAQVVRLPLNDDDFSAAMRRIAIQFGHPISQSRVITVFGAAEGTGVTSIALNLAAEIGRLRSAPCLLAEGAVGFGRLANYLGISPLVTLGDLINDIDRVDIDRFRQAITKVDNDLHVITGSHSEIVSVDLTIEKALRLISYAKQINDIIVVDGRYNYEELDLEFAAHSQQVVLVAQPSLTSIFGLGRILTILSQRKCLAQQYVVINRHLPDTKEFSARSIEKLLHIPKVFTVASDWRSFQAAELAGKTLHNSVPRSHALADISALARDMLGMPPEPPKAGWSFLNSWNSLTHAFSLK
jgi:pilus assembly protein CpaE